ncbi:MD-2-related lipid-recognition protein-like [Daktulosphaira vitifoliae]|uniref:MD-2-related lipid-recognition protein-like n=1 Tax=Daktulosphaira vitifoliae TaxID=58002 RepID=UPI0021A98C60|nr:MD-2-related lipid-recognition protein-like [Daktulosphaira vitifoliae]
MKYLILILIGFFLNIFIYAEEITNFRPCSNSNCVVTNVHINPCPEALDGNTCEVPLGENASISFDYNPQFTSNTPKARFYGIQIIDLPYPGTDPDGCLYTNCPIQMNITQKFKFEIEVPQIIPKGDHLAKLKLWNDDENSILEDRCCIIFDLKFV